MNDDFFKDRAKAVRDIADKADPFTKKRLLELATRYDRGKPTPRATPLPAVTVEEQADHQDGGADPA